jgi:putative tryptophan/tyrosine transport system substrate-binding protein
MRRREFISLIGGAAAIWPLAARAALASEASGQRGDSKVRTPGTRPEPGSSARPALASEASGQRGDSKAQQAEMPVVGFLNAASRDLFAHVLSAFHAGLNETGYVEGQNVEIEYRWADGQYDRLSALAADLVRRRVGVIATGSNINAAMAAKTATTKIPIVFLTGADPVKDRLVASLNRPGGNLTGVTTLNVEIAPKRLEALRELLPTTTVVAMLVNPINDPSIVRTDLRQAQAAAQTLGLRMIHILQASTERDLEGAFATLTQRRAGGLVVSADTLFSGKSAELAQLALRHGVPTISPYREFARAGGLMSYGVRLTDLYRLVGVYAGRILKGEKPADLPVQQATKMELVINLKTAKALGVDVPPTLLARADEVIE